MRPVPLSGKVGKKPHAIRRPGLSTAASTGMTEGSSRRYTNDEPRIRWDDAEVVVCEQYGVLLFCAASIISTRK